MRGQITIRWILAGVILAGGSLACTQPSAPPPPPRRATPAETTYLEHVIRYPGETLAFIAAWYTGKATNWTIIESANPGVRADKLRIGQVLQLPENILVRRDPLPQSFLRRPPEKLPSDVAVSGGEVTPSETAPPETPVAETAPSGTGESLTGTETGTQVVTPPVETTPEVVTPPPPVEKSPEDLEKEKLLDELLK